MNLLPDMGGEATSVLWVVAEFNFPVTFDQK